MKTAFLAVSIAVAMYSVDEINSCFERELETCSDRVCEMSTDDNAKVIEQVQSNIVECLERKRK